MITCCFGLLVNNDAHGICKWQTFTPLPRTLSSRPYDHVGRFLKWKISKLLIGSIYIRLYVFGRLFSLKNFLNSCYNALFHFVIDAFCSWVFARAFNMSQTWTCSQRESIGPFVHGSLPEHSIWARPKCAPKESLLDQCIRVRYKHEIRVWIQGHQWFCCAISVWNYSCMCVNDWMLVH